MQPLGSGARRRDPEIIVKLLVAAKPEQSDDRIQVFLRTSQSPILGGGVSNPSAVLISVRCD